LLQTDFVIALFEFALLVMSISAHEFAHAWMASRQGDNTARTMGRVTLNPMAHMDPIGMLLVPLLLIFIPSLSGGVLFGWGKTVPVTRRNLRHFARDESLVSLAGPVTNLVIAIAAFLGIAILFFAERLAHASVNPPLVLMTVQIFLYLAIQINLALFIFNLIPIPPLDGSRLLHNAVPYDLDPLFSHISGPVSYILMAVIGRVVLGFALHPVYSWLDTALAHI
jgi:Zn-dependent protease